MAPTAPPTCVGGVFECLDILGSFPTLIALLFGLIVFGGTLEHGLDHIHKAVRNSRLGQTVVSAILSELVVLGFVSFGLFTIVLTGGDLGHTALLIFEFAHLTIFLSTVLFVCFVLWLWKSISELLNTWERWEVDSNEGDWKRVRDTYESTRGSSLLTRWRRGVFRTRKEEQAQVHFYFCGIRRAFLEQQSEFVASLNAMLNPDMPPMETVDPHHKFFSAYLRKCMGSVIIDVVGLGWHIWVMFLVLCSLGYLLFLVLVAADVVDESGDIVNKRLFFVMVALSYVLLALSIVTKSKMRRICAALHNSVKDQVCGGLLNLDDPDAPPATVGGVDRAALGAALMSPLPDDVIERCLEEADASPDYATSSASASLPNDGATSSVQLAATSAELEAGTQQAKTGAAAAAAGPSNSTASTQPPPPFLRAATSFSPATVSHDRSRGVHSGGHALSFLPWYPDKPAFWTLYWFQSPRFIIRLFQSLMLFQAIQLTTFFLVFVWIESIPIYWHVLYVLPLFHSIGVFAPQAIAYYCLGRFVGPLALPQYVREVVLERSITPLEALRRLTRMASQHSRSRGASLVEG